MEYKKKTKKILSKEDQTYTKRQTDRWTWKKK